MDKRTLDIDRFEKEKLLRRFCHGEPRGSLRASRVLCASSTDLDRFRHRAAQDQYPGILPQPVTDTLAFLHPHNEIDAIEVFQQRVGGTRQGAWSAFVEARRLYDLEVANRQRTPHAQQQAEPPTCKMASVRRHPRENQQNSIALACMEHGVHRQARSRVVSTFARELRRHARQGDPAPAIELRVYNGCSRGLIAAREIQPGEVVLSVMKTSVLHGSDVESDEAVARFLEQICTHQAWESTRSRRQAALRCFLARHGEERLFLPPEDMMHFTSFTADDVCCIPGMYERWQYAMAGARVERIAANVSDAAYRRARQLVDTRSFAVRTDDVALIPLMDMMNHHPFGNTALPPEEEGDYYVLRARIPIRKVW